MTINKHLCEKLYQDVKTKLQEVFVEQGMTFRGAETAIWKLQNPKNEKTYFQVFLEESSNTSFLGTFNHMYLWRKMNETQSRENINFQEDYLLLFVKFLGFENIQTYISLFSKTLNHFFGIKKEGDIVVIQPIFDANKTNQNEFGKYPRENEQTVDSRDTECLLELINLFHEHNRILPKRIYDQDLVKEKEDLLIVNETVLESNSINCIFSIGFYSNAFFKWIYQDFAHQFIKFEREPMVSFRIQYFNESLKKNVWTDKYTSNDDFDTGFLMKTFVKIKGNLIPCFCFCGIENRATKAITSYLCTHWKGIQQKQDFERNELVAERPFIMIFKVKKDDLNEIYCEKTIVLDLKMM
jgi:hypothetical protein